MNRHITVSGVNLEIVEKGQGRPLLFLHPGEGLRPGDPWLDQLAMHHRVVAPHHPGFGGSARKGYPERPATKTSPGRRSSRRAGQRVDT